MWSWGIEGNLAQLQRGGNGIVRQTQQQGTLFRRELVAGNFRGRNG
jgi:hypothetical protein